MNILLEVRAIVYSKESIVTINMLPLLIA